MTVPDPPGRPRSAKATGSSQLKHAYKVTYGCHCNDDLKASVIFKS